MVRPQPHAPLRPGQRREPHPRPRLRHHLSDQLPGTEPDPRWSLANERTLLAYIRTALSLVVAGLAVAGTQPLTEVPVWLAALGLPLIALGAAVALWGRRRFFATQEAMRLGQPLTVPATAVLLPVGIALVAVAGLALATVALVTS
ncbi:MAG TPA: DUF202 domain-containing protein [Acidimicrobiales bacterium]|nr:DUF202 domain-containing protein [Acidimicrobiales bacterium]